MTRDTEEPTADPWTCWQNFPWKKKTQVLTTSSKREITLSLDMKQICSRKFSVSVCFICSVNILFVVVLRGHVLYAIIMG